MDDQPCSYRNTRRYEGPVPPPIVYDVPVSDRCPDGKIQFVGGGSRLEVEARIPERDGGCLAFMADGSILREPWIEWLDGPRG